MADSISKALEKALTSRIEEIVETKILPEALKELEMFWAETANPALKELFIEANDMYKSLIDDYYSYKTKVYSRHSVGTGTGTGVNLYRGNKIKFNGGKFPSITIDFSGESMAGYQKGSTDEVLNQVMNGVRGVPPYWWMTWTGSYQGKYFSVSGATVKSAFDIFMSYSDDLFRTIYFDVYYKAAINSGKYKWMGIVR